MIINNVKTVSQAVGLGAVRKASIVTDAKIFSMFESQVYTDKPLAIIRELVANGNDATKNGRPMTVTLPTDYTPYMTFRDYGTGMPYDFVMGAFMDYTTSTKTNDNTAIGCLGIGSKSPLSYTEQVSFKSFQNGEVNVYVMYKDEDNCPAMTHLSTSPTDEPDGIEITFPIEGSDVKTFRDTVPRALEYFNPLPILVNAEHQLIAPEYTVKSATWGFRRGSTTSRVVMGGIAYPLDAKAARDAADLVDFGIDFIVPIGACSIALSREGLSYDEKTLRVIKSMCDSMKPDLEAHVASMFSNCKTLWEAQQLYHSETSQGNPNRARLVRQHATWKGKKLTGTFRRSHLPAVAGQLLLGLITSDRYSRTSYQYWTEGTSSPLMRAWQADIHPKDISMVLIDDGAAKPVLRMRNYLENNNIKTQGVMIIRPMVGSDPISKVEIAKLLIALGRPPYTLLSTIEPAVVVRVTSATPARKSIRYYKSRDFNFPSRTSTKGDTLPGQSGYYMLMHNFRAPDGIVQASAEQLRASGLDPADVYWFNAGDFDGIKDDPLWKPALIAYQLKEATYRSTHRNLGLAEAFWKLSKNLHTFNSNRSGVLLRTLDLAGFNVPKQGPLYQLNKLYLSVKGQLTHQDKSMRDLLKVDSEKEILMLDALVKDIHDKYPDLWLMVSDFSIGSNSKFVSIFNRLV